MHVQLCRVHRLRWSHDTRRRYSSRHFLNHSTTTIPGWRATGRSGTHDVIVNTSQHAIIHFLWMCKHAMHCCLLCARRTYLLQHNSGIDPQALSRTPRAEQLLTRHPKTSNPSWVILSKSHQLHCFRHAETSTAYSEEKLSQITDSMLQLQQDLVQALLTLAQLAQCKMWIRSAQCT